MVTMTLGEMQLYDKLAKIAHEHQCVIEPCGSRITNPGREISEYGDLDVLFEVRPKIEGVGRTDKVVRVEDVLSEVDRALHEAGFEWEGSNQHYQDVAQNSFMSLRQESINVLVTTNAAWAERHRAATHVCKELRLADKRDRVMVFQAVLYGAKWDRQAEKKLTQGFVPQALG